MTDSSVTGRNQNHSDVRDESARDNDPLFELSRIFGFDEPAEQKNIYTPQAEPELSSEMSLERELMAGFDADFATDFAVEPEPLASNYQPEPLASNYRPEPLASNYQPEPAVSSYQPMQQDYRPAAPAASESRSAQRVVEPHFSGYAPLQRAYAPQAPADSFVDQQPAAEPEATQYYAEPDYAQAAPAASQDSYYAAYSDLPQAPAFSEPVQDDYFTSLDNALNESFADEPAPQPLADTSAFDLSEIGREPQQEFVAQTYDNVFADNQSYNAAPQPASASFEDELSFLLQDAAPVAAPVQPVAPRYEEPAYAAAPSAYQPASYSEPVIPQTDFAPLFDAPAPDVAPVVTRFDEQETAVENNYAAAPAADFDQVDDEFFAAPDLSHLPNRTSAPQSNWDAEQSDDGAVNSFADLFGASSQPDTAVQNEADNSYQPEQAVSYEEQQSESFDFADDFYSAEESNTVAEQAYASEPVAPLSHNAVRGYSSYTFGAATPAAAGTESVVSQYHTPEPTYDAAPVAAVPVVSAPAYEEPAAADNFFNNDDFDFSFDEDIQPENDFSVAEEELTFELPEEPEVPAYEPVQTSAHKSYTPAPDIETVVVSENKVEQTQSLDLPEVSYGDDAKATGLNSLESEFAEIFSTISVNEAAAPDTTSEADKAFENILQDNFAEFHAAKKAEPQQPEADHGYGTLAGAVAGLAGAAVAGAAMRGSAPQARTDAAGNATQDDYYNHWAAQGAQNNDFDTYNLNENFARDEEDYTEVRPYEKAQQRKPLFWAGVAAAALIVVGGGYYVLKSGGVVGGEPEVLRADSQPVKMQPENPGGAIVPNQDKAVYDQVSGTKPATPEQKTLINTEEEPVDVGLLAGQDVEEDRLMAEEATNNGNSAPAAAKPSAQEAERELVTPRTVRTMVVRADGTIVPSEAPAAPSEPAPTDTGLDEASRLISQSAVPERLGTDKPAASTQSAAAPRVVQTQTFTASGEQVKPTAAPVVPSRPAEQPVNVVGNVERPAQNQNQAPQQVANANVPAANTAAPAGTWFIQVASQPSAELAQKNYANLTSRYGNIIGGKGVDIKKADIPGKGTYYRVRIPGGSKAEAAALCDRLKSAGGSCFPTL